MRITRLTAENVKKIRAVDIAPDGSVIQITGPNGSGKTSVLDAIYYALAGTKHIASEPIRRGEASATIRLELGEITVTRKFTESGTSLIVEAASGARFPSPQTMLDQMLGSLTFDPLAFTRMSPKAQLEQLRALVTLDVDIDVLAAQNRADFETRTGINRTIRTLEGALSDRPVTLDELPEQPIDIAELLKEQQAAFDHNQDLIADKRRGEDALEVVDRKAKDVAQLRVTAAKLRAEAQAHDDQATQLEQWVHQAREDLAAVPAPGEPIDLQAIALRIQQASLINEGIEHRARYRAIEAELMAAEERASALTQGMEARQREREQALARATMPIAGLTFGEEGVIYNGLPFEQASGAEQLRVSVAIAMGANPKLRVLRIKDGSLLDAASLALIAHMAEEGDYQIWIEQVDTSGKVGIVMEDGTVRIPTEESTA